MYRKPTPGSAATSVDGNYDATRAEGNSSSSSRYSSSSANSTPGQLGVCPPEAPAPYVFIPHPLYTASGLLATNPPMAESISNTHGHDSLAAADNSHQAQAYQPADYLEMANLFQSLPTGNDSMANTLWPPNEPPILRCHECGKPASGETSHCPAAVSCQRIHCMICGLPNLLFCTLHPDVQYHLATFPNRPLTIPIRYAQHRPIIPGICLSCTCRQPVNLSTLDTLQPRLPSQPPTTTTTTTTCGEDTRKGNNYWNGDKDDQQDDGQATSYRTITTPAAPADGRCLCKSGFMLLPMLTTLAATIICKFLHLPQSQLPIISLLVLTTPASARPCACGSCESEWFTWGWWCPIAWQFVLPIDNNPSLFYNTTDHCQWRYPTTTNDLPTSRLPTWRTSVLVFEAQTGYNGVRFGRFLGKNVLISLWAEAQCIKYLCPEGVLVRARWFRKDDEPSPKRPKLLLLPWPAW